MLKTIVGGIGKALGSVAKPIFGHLNKKQERKQAKEQAYAKLEQSKVDGNFKVQFTNQEWEAIKASQETETWKDEYVTVIVTLPIVTLLGGGIASVFGYPQLLEGTVKGIEAIQALDVDFGALMQTVVYAAVGIRVVKKFL